MSVVTGYIAPFGTALKQAPEFLAKSSDLTYVNGWTRCNMWRIGVGGA